MINTSDCIENKKEGSVSNTMQERRKKRGPIIDFLLLGLIVTLTTVILVIILSKDEFKFQKISASKEESKTESVNSNLSTESSAFPGIRIVTDVSNDKRTPFAIHYPQTDNKVFNDAVLQYISDSKENYLASMKKIKIKKLWVN